jgi:hypothetical protein
MAAEPDLFKKFKELINSENPKGSMMMLPISP